MSFTPSEAEKKEMLAEHFPYEFEMMVDALGSLPSSPGFEQSRHLETIVFHARGLIFFFGDKSANPNFQKDSNAKDFIKVGETWTEEADLDLATRTNLKLVKERGSKELAHLTYERVPSKTVKTTWNLLGIVAEMLDVVKDFRGKCKEEYITRRFTNVVSDADALVKSIQEALSKSPKGGYSWSYIVTSGTSVSWVSTTLTGIGT